MKIEKGQSSEVAYWRGIFYALVTSGEQFSYERKKRFSTTGQTLAKSAEIPSDCKTTVESTTKLREQFRLRRLADHWDLFH